MSKLTGHVSLYVTCVSTVLQRIQAAGAYLTTAESLIFMLVKDANHPQFKAISGLVKAHAGIENPFASTVH